jgi:hypothetical protein
MSQPSDPAPTQPIHDAILAARTQAILFRQIVPPNYDPTHLSFFGGLPIAPSGFPWPRGESRPHSFVMQVDCSAVPADGRLGMFPELGVLYVFLDLAWDYEWGYEGKFCVIWEPGPSRGWAEIPPPEIFFTLMTIDSHGNGPNRMPIGHASYRNGHSIRS